ncbi:MAG: choice-of-anchor M domain-containing protein [Verrucomicrobiota bacterium]
MKATRPLLATALALLLLPAAAPARTILTTEHADIGIGYEGGWDLHVHDDDNDIEYDPDEVLLYLGPNARKSADSFEAGFTGSAEGEDLWVLPQGPQNPTLLYLGVGSEFDDLTDFGAWAPSDTRVDFGGDEFVWFRLNLESVSGPGQFSVYTDDNIVWMSSIAAPTDGNHLYILRDGHNHYNWTFSATGLYEVSFSATTELANGDLVTSTPVTYLFGVEVVPEPTTGSLLLLAAGFALARRRSGRA